MNMTNHTRLDLVEGGSIFKQGEHAQLAFNPRDYSGKTVDLTGKDIAVAIWNSKGIMYEGTASFDSTAQLIRLTINQLLQHGDFQIEFTVTDAADPDYRRKFPSGEYEGKIYIKPSADNIDFVGVSMTTVEQIRKEISDASASFTKDGEVILARMGEDSLLEHNEKVVRQLAGKANQKELGVERARINNLVANAGDVTGNAELLDLRVAFDGLTYTSAGGAIRSVAKLFDVEPASRNLYNLLSPAIMPEKGFAQLTNNIVDVPNMQVTDYMPMPGGGILRVSENGVESNKPLPSSSYKVAAYTSDGTWISTQSSYAPGGWILPANTYRIRMHVPMDVSGIQVELGTVTPYTPFNNQPTTLKKDSLPTVTAKDTDFFEVATNMFDKNDPDILLNKGYSNSTSEIVNSNAHNISGWLNGVTGGDVIFVSHDGAEGTGEASAIKFVAYNEAGEWLSTQTYMPGGLVAPAGTAKGKLHYRNSYTDIQIEVGQITEYHEGPIRGAQLKKSYLPPTFDERLNELEALINEFGEDIGLFVSGGQSNESGRGALPSPLQSIPELTLFANDYKWKTLTEPADDNTGQVDAVSEDTHANKHSSLLSTGLELYNVRKEKLSFVTTAKGGTTTTQWMPPASRFDRTTLFGSADYRTKQALKRGRELKAILWYQGEGDANNPEQYQENHAEIVQKWRENYGLRPFIYTQLGVNTTVQSAYDAMREMQRKMEDGTGEAVSIQQHYMIPVHDLPVIDQVHLSQEGQIELGRRRARMIRQVVYGEDINGTGPRLKSITQSTATTIKVETSRPINDHATYDDYFTVLDGTGSLSFTVKRDPADVNSVLITLSAAPTGTVRVRYQPPIGRPLHTWANNVIKDSDGLPLPAFGALNVPF